MKAEKTAPRWLQVMGGVASVAMLAAISSVNIWPSLKSGNYHRALVQIALTVTVAISRHIPVLDPVARNRIVIAFMAINGCFAFQGAEQLRDGDAQAHRQYRAWTEELDGKDGQSGKRAELAKLGSFTPTKQSQVDDARATITTADKDKTTARKDANEAQSKYTACKRACDKLKTEAGRLETLAQTKEAEAKTAHDELERLSGWLALTEQAAPLKTRIAELEKSMSEHPDKGEDSTERWILQEAFALFLALVIELANRYAPSAIFGFIVALAPSKAELPVHELATRTSKTPSPSAPPQAPRSAPKPKVQASGIVLSMEDRAKVVHADRFKGMSEQKIANTLGWHKPMVHRALNYRGSTHAAPARGSVNPAHGSVQAIA